MGTLFLEHEGGRIAYDDSGTGPLVVAVPSMGDLRQEYRFLTPRLTAAGYRVVSMDVRGHGESSTEWKDFSVAGVGSDIVALVRKLNAGKALLVGTSMAAGGGVWAAAEAPELLAGLALIGPFVRGGGKGTDKLLLGTMFAKPWGAWAWVKYYQTLYPTRKPDDFQAYVTALGANLREPGRLEALQQMLFASKAASEERLGRVTVPARVFMGSKDPDFKPPEKEAAWVAEQLHTTYELIPDAGHYPQAEMPEVFAPMLVEFFGGVVSSQSSDRRDWRLGRDRELERR